MASIELRLKKRETFSRRIAVAIRFGNTSRSALFASFCWKAESAGYEPQNGACDVSMAVDFRIVFDRHTNSAVRLRNNAPHCDNAPNCRNGMGKN